MPLQTSLARQLGLRYPVVQAPMAGGATTPELVAAVCEAGALGFLAAAYLQPVRIRELASQVRARTSRPFGINLFAPLPAPDPPADARAALRRISGFHAELGLAQPVLPEAAAEPFEEQLAAALDSGASVFSFTFGLLPHDALDAVKSRGMFVMGTATTVDEAILLEKAGVDAVIAQGSEAGAHRGTFATDFASSMIGSMALIPQVADVVRVPVVASGGIMDGRGIVAALALGASAVQMGTAFLVCHESGVPEAHKAAILGAHEDQTRITRAFSGRPARGIVNQAMAEIEAAGDPAAILPYPLQNALTRPMRSAAAKQGRAEYLSLWAGQGVRLARRQSASELIAHLSHEAEAAVGQVSLLP
ncbi:MAG TPA: nitronate monooxygenase [Patescibacteria group bacterium]|nr:nitronate monooxygenase [Patescibacteria group bacterium]